MTRKDMANARMFLGILLCILSLRNSEGAADDDIYIHKQELLKLLLDGYDKNIIPTAADGRAVEVNHSMDILRVIGLDDQVLTLQTFVMMQWQDSQLTWLPEDHGGVTQLHLPSELIWQPDIVLLNSAEEYSGFPSGDLKVIVFNDGKVIFVPPTISKSFCSVDNSHLYKDNEVTCTLPYMSWIYDSSYLDLRTKTPGIRLNNFENEFNKEWKLVDSSVEREVKTFECCPDLEFPEIKYTIKLKRRA